MSIRLTVAVSVLVAAFPGAAQTDRQEERNVRATSLDYGDCVVARYPQDAEQVVVSQIDNDEISRRYRRLNNVGCMGRATEGTAAGGVRYSGDNFRYMLSEALVRMHFSTVAAPSFGAVPPLSRPPVEEPAIDAPSGEAQLRLSLRRREDASEDYAERRAFDLMSRLGECVARSAPEATRLLALTETGTPGETAALDALRPAIAQCIPPGTTIRLRPAHVRGAALMNYFRLARAAQAAIASGETAAGQGGASRPM